MPARKGNILLPLISAVAIVAIVAAGYFFFQNKQLQKASSNQEKGVSKLLPQAAGESETLNWKIHENKSYGFTIKYPPSWDAGENIFSSDRLALLFSRTQIPKEYLKMGLTHGWGELSIWTNPQVFSEENLDCNKIDPGEKGEDGTIYEAVICLPTTFSGVRANKSYNTSMSRAGEGSSTSIIFNYQSKAWTISYPNKNYSGDHDGIYDQILSTFKFINQDSEQKQTAVKVFFNNKKLASDPNFLECGKVFPVMRQVPQTKAIAKAAIEQWLKGPAPDEKAQGFTGGTREGEVRLNKVAVADGVALVDLHFEKQSDGGTTIRKYIAGSCAIESFVSQVKATVKQFPTIEEVKIAVDGSVDDFNSWASNP